MCALLLAGAFAFSGCRPDVEQASKKMKLTSTAFADGEPIPAKYTGLGKDVSPPLSWTGLPSGTHELALICEDPDAREGPFVHWVIYKIPRTVNGLPEAIPNEEQLHNPPDTLQGKNSFETGAMIGYRGPRPPPGQVHHYIFKLYALDKKIPFEVSRTKEKLLAVMQGHIIGETQLTGTFQREAGSFAAPHQPEA